MTRYPKISREIEQKDIVGNFSATDDATGTFTGYLSTFGGPPDKQGDVVLRGAFRQTIKDAQARRAANGLDYLWPLLYGHSFDALPIGGIVSAVEDSHGLLIRAKLATDTSMGHDVYVLAKQKMLNTMSIGYKTIHCQWQRDSGQAVRELTEIQLIEGSITEIPANENARILSVKAGGYAMPGKSFDSAYQEELAEDWMYSDWSSLCCALQDSIQETFTDGGDPLQNLEQNVLPGLANALRQYIQDGIGLNAADYLQQQSSSGMDMMSSSQSYDSKAGRTLSSANHAVLSKATKGITAQVGTIQAALEKERAAQLQGYPLYGSASARHDFSSKSMSAESHAQIAGATTNIMGHVRSITSMQASARRQNQLRGFPIVHSTHSADLDLEDKLAIRAMTAELRETTESMERDRDPAVQHLRDLRESLPSLTTSGPSTLQRLEGAQASIAVDLALRALLDARAED